MKARILAACAVVSIAAPAAAQTDPYAPQPAADPWAQPPPQPAQGGWYAGDPPAAPRPTTGVVFDLRLAFLATGSGEVETTCDGDCGGFDEDSDNYDDESGIALGGDVLARSGPNLRLGGGLLYEIDTAVDTREDLDLGTDLSLHGVVEGAFPVSPTVDLVARGTLGLMFLFPGGDLEDAIEEIQDLCDGDPYYYPPYGGGGGGYGPPRDCSVDDGPYLGWSIGAGGAALFALSGVTLRVDLALQYLRLDMLEVSGESADGDDTTTTATVVGTRFWIGAGVEL
jgi:hypothetical protein